MLHHELLPSELPPLPSGTPGLCGRRTRRLADHGSLFALSVAARCEFSIGAREPVPGTDRLILVFSFMASFWLRKWVREFGTRVDFFKHAFRLESVTE